MNRSKLLPILFAVLLAFVGFIFFSFFNSNFSLSGPVEFQDKNKNGIWDDVEPFINQFAQTPEQRSALEYKFKSFQEILLHPEIGTVLKDRVKGYDKNGIPLRQEPVDHMFKANDCIYKVYGSEPKADLEDIENAILKSPARIKAYLRFNANLSGGSYTSWNADWWGDPCPPL